MIDLRNYLVVEAARDERGVLRLVPDPRRAGAHAGARRAPVDTKTPVQLSHFGELFEPFATAIEDHPHLRQEIAAGCLLLRGEARAASSAEAMKVVLAKPASSGSTTSTPTVTPSE